MLKIATFHYVLASSQQATSTLSLVSLVYCECWSPIDQATYDAGRGFERLPSEETVDSLASEGESRGLAASE